MSDKIHVYPTTGKMKSTHIIKKDKPCWCDLEEVQCCPEVLSMTYNMSGEGNCPKTCWRCGGRGLVPVYTDELSVILLHSDGQLTDE